MASKAISNIKLTDSLTISECKDGYWLYDETRGMNLSMGAETEQDAYVEAITYYQKRCAEVEQKKKKLYDSVNNFIESLSDNDEVYTPCDCTY
jgi:fumarate hydratase class II